MDPSVLDVLDVDDIILRLLDGRGGKRVEVSEGEIRQLCLNARELFLRQPCLLELKAPVQIVGDTHGHYQDLLRWFEICGFPPTTNYLFLGNYVEFGFQSLETILLLLAFKTRYPENFFLLKGNHECASVSSKYVSRFYHECERRFSVRLWRIFGDCFNCMPVAALVNDKIFCVHGGLSPDLDNLDQIRDIERPTDIPDSGLLCDLLWSDPSFVTGWGLNTVRGVTFGEDKVTEFIEKHDLDLICRGNQVAEEGYEFFAGRQLVTVFSAPNYRLFENAGAIISIDENLVCSFNVLKPPDVFLGKKLGESEEKQNSGSLNVTSSESSSGIEPPPKVDFAGIYESRFFCWYPAERVKKPYVWSWSNTNAYKSESSSGLKSESSSGLKSPGFKLGESEKKQNSGSLNVTSSESSSGIEPPPKVVFDPTSLYRSKSPGVKRFLGARV